MFDMVCTITVAVIGLDECYCDSNWAATEYNRIYLQTNELFRQRVGIFECESAHRKIFIYWWRSKRLKHVAY
jgi:hypothetical protein